MTLKRFQDLARLMKEKYPGGVRGISRSSNYDGWWYFPVDAPGGNCLLVYLATVGNIKARWRLDDDLELQPVLDVAHSREATVKIVSRLTNMIEDHGLCSLEREFYQRMAL